MTAHGTDPPDNRNGPANQPVSGSTDESPPSERPDAVAILPHRSDEAPKARSGWSP